MVMSKKKSCKSFRLIHVFSLIAILLALLTVNCKKKQEKKIVTVVSWGGKYQDALFDNWVLPSAKKIDIVVQGRSYTGEYNTITRMAESGTVTWDLIQVETFYAAQAKNDGHLDKFSPPVASEKIALKEGFISMHGYACPTIGWSYALAWNQEALEKVRKIEREPTNWKDFWDLEAFPGKRALRDVPQGNIEIALLADGMTVEEIEESLYRNEDLRLLDRAFNKLSQLKREVVWWTSGDQIQRELESGAVTLAATWNGRVWKAIKDPITKHKSFDIRISYEQAILDYDWWIIPKGSRNVKQASDLVNAMYKNVDGAIKFAQDMGYGPPIKDWEEHVTDKELTAKMPTTQENIAVQLTTDPSFWANNFRQISDRWSKWRAQ